MSFILDALKKLDQKHQRGTVPDLMTIHSPERQKHARRMIWPYLVLGALVLNAGILAAVFRPWEAENKKPASNVPVRPYIKKNEPASVQPQGKMTAAVPDKKTVAPKAAKVAANDAADTKKAMTIPKHENAPAPSESIIIEPPQGEDNSVDNRLNSNEDRPSTLSLNPSPQDMEILRKKIKEETFRSSVTPARKTPPPIKASAAPVGQVPDISELPEDIKKELSNINISAHIYSNDPHSRIVTVNGSTVKEGDEVTGGLKVSEITMTGVIFEYGGRRFQVRAF